MSRIAAIDIGTNSILLTIVEMEQGSLHTLCERSRITRLGEGLNALGRLSEEPMRRSLTTLREYLDACQQAGVETVLAVGTEVLRKASNAQDFLQACARMGLEVEVISGEREAQLSYLSVIKDPVFASAGDRLTMLDVGGGSVEISRGAGGKLRTSHSYPIGAVRLTEALLHHDPPLLNEVQALQQAVQEAVAGEPRLAEGETLVGVGGTFVNLACLHRGCEHFEPERAHGDTLTLEEMLELSTLLCSVPVAERRKLPGIEPDRAPVLHAGALISCAVMRHLHAPSISVSMRGLRWGLLYEYADAHRD